MASSWRASRTWPSTAPCPPGRNWSRRARSSARAFRQAAYDRGEPHPATGARRPMNALASAVTPASQESARVVEARGRGLTFQANDGPVRALSDVTLMIGKGEFVSFIGPSGCGKTTFLRVIADLEAR